MDVSLTKRGLESVYKAQNVLENQQNQQHPKVRLGGIYNLLEKTSHFLAVAIPSGMTCTAPTVIEIKVCEVSELPRLARTFDCRNS